MSQIKRKADTGESGNPGQFGSASREEHDLDLSTLPAHELACAQEETGDEEDLGDAVQADGDLDIIREGDNIRLEGTVTAGGVIRTVNEDLGPMTSVGQLRAAIVAAVQRAATS